MAKQLDLGIANTLVSVHAGRPDSSYRQQGKKIAIDTDNDLL